MKTTRLLFALCSASLLTFSASAKPVTWTLSNVTFWDGGTASGSFVYDADTQTYSAINITTTDGSRRTGATYHFAQTTRGPSQYGATFLTSASNQAGLPALLLVFPSGLSDSGGSVFVATPISIEVTCNSPNCDLLTGPQRYVTGGTLEAATLGGCSSNSSHGHGKCTPPVLPPCEATGGKTVYRQATYGTNANNHAAWLTLDNVHAFCEYTSAQDGSMAAIFVDTLTAEKPTLAALAYDAKVPSTVPPGPGNPASQYCAQLGGVSQFGGPSDSTGGGWVNMSAKQNVVSVCVFPDTSAIDAFALFYHSAGVIRGIDLSTVMLYKPPTGKKSMTGDSY